MKVFEYSAVKAHDDGGDGSLHKITHPVRFELAPNVFLDVKPGDEKGTVEVALSSHTQQNLLAVLLRYANKVVIKAVRFNERNTNPKAVR